MFTLAQLARVSLEAEPQLAFTVLEIGALPLKRQSEPAHQLLDAFPESRINAFEIDKQLCAELNRKARRGIRFYPVAPGRTEEVRPLYETAHPMCPSLYKPNEPLLARYFNLEVAMLKSVGSVQTVSLDRFAADNGVTDSDAMFVREVLKLDQLAPQKLLKLAAVAHLYGSPDLMFDCFARYEKRSGNSIIQKLLGKEV